MKLINTLNKRLAPIHGVMKTVTRWCNLTMLFLSGVIVGAGLLHWNQEREQQVKNRQQPAVEINTRTNSDTSVYRDRSDSIYIPLTMAECSTICAKEAQGSSGLSTKGAGNALDNTSGWPKEAKYVAFYGNEGELWIYQKDGVDWIRVNDVISTDTVVHLILWDPKRP